MTRAKKAKAIAEDFEFDPTADDPFAFPESAPEDDEDPFAFLDDPVADEWLNLPGEPSETIAHDMLVRALAEDPFTTTDLDDCLPAEGIAPVAFSRYLRASASFIAACRALEPDYEEQEIHRLIAIYWLKKSRPMWLD
jgi:hypothetical protein